MPLNRPSPRRAGRVAAALLGAAALSTTGVAALTPSAGAASNASQALAAGRYLVTFADEPAATYEGHVAGYARTRPDAG